MNKKDKVLKIYVDAKEHAKIKSKIASFGVSISEYFLKLYNDKPLLVRERNEHLKKINDLRAIGNNLNQIARHLNSGKEQDIKLKLSLANTLDKLDIELNKL